MKQTSQGWLQAGLFYRVWRPEKARASCVICHGYAEHSGRYQAVAKRLVSENLAVYALDLPGHGHSEGKRASAPSVRALVPALQATLEHAKGQHPEVPHVLFGHSMGGLLALQLCLTGYPLDLLCVSGAILQNAVAVSAPLKAAAHLLARVAPELPVQKLEANDLAFDARVIARYQNDPWVYQGKVRAGLGYGLISEGAEVLAQAHQITLPTLIMHGEYDSTADPAGSHQLYAQLGSSDKMLELFDGKHEILNDWCGDHVLDVLTQWLNQRLN